MAERKYIQHYHSVNSGSVPSIDELKTGELALNVADEKIFFKNSNNELVTISKGGVIKTTYNELLELRNNSGLTPGQEYQITDYQCTTIQPGTSAATNQFDIIVVANDVNVLSEEARATHHEGDTYFANQNLGAWKLWYSMDRGNYAWASSNESLISFSYAGMFMINAPYRGLFIYNDKEYHSWDATNDFKIAMGLNENDIVYILTETLEVTSGTTAILYLSQDGETQTGEWAFDSTLQQILKDENFRGVIYRFKDDLNHDIPFDFKNILHVIDGGYAYTFISGDFTQDASSIIGKNTFIEGGDKIPTIIIASGYNINIGKDSSMIIINMASSNIKIGHNCNNISLYSSDIVIGNNCENININENGGNIKIGDYCTDISFQRYSKNITIESGASNISDTLGSTYRKYASDGTMYSEADHEKRLAELENNNLITCGTF